MINSPVRGVGNIAASSFRSHSPRLSSTRSMHTLHRSLVVFTHDVGDIPETLLFLPRYKMKRTKRYCFSIKALKSYPDDMFCLLRLIMAKGRGRETAWLQHLSHLCGFTVMCAEPSQVRQVKQKTNVFVVGTLSLEAFWCAAYATRTSEIHRATRVFAVHTLQNKRL